MSSDKEPIDFRQVFPVIKDRGNGRWMANCPAHEDGRSSLSVSMGAKGVCLRCFAGCSLADIVSAVDLKVSDLFYDRGSSKLKRRERETIETIYSYRDEKGRELYQVVRMKPKSFRQRHKVGRDFVWNLDGVRRVPYHLDKLAANPKSPVAITEGEKDVDALTAIGLLATCNSGGAGKWELEFGYILRGRKVAIFPDNDEPGLAHAASVAGSAIYWGAESVRIVSLGGEKKSDVSDFLKTHKKDELLKAISAAREYRIKE